MMLNGSVGRSMGIFVAAALAVSAPIGCVGCKEQSPHAVEAREVASAAPHADEATHDELPKRVHLTPEVIEAAKIKSVRIGKEVLDLVLELPGEIAADPDRSAQVSAPIGGRIERIAFVEGATVKAHELMAVVRVTDLADRQAAYASAAARAQAAASTLRRTEGLRGSQLSTEQELETHRAEAAALEAEARAAAERLHVLGLGTTGKPGSLLELRAPLGGTVVKRDAVVGQPIAMNQVIATIVALEKVWFQGRVFEHDLARVDVGARAEVVLNAFPAQRFEGHIEYLGREVDPVARTVVARVGLANEHDRLRLGLFGTARISGGEAQRRPPVLVVSRNAVTEIGGKPFVFVHHPDDDFELHAVVLGRHALGKIEIVSGLREGEEVVVEGVFTLKSVVLAGSFGEEE